MRGLLSFVRAFVLIACQVIRSYGGELSYTIVGSKFIQANSNYEVSVSIHDVTYYCSIQLTIQNNKDYKQSKLVTVLRGTTKVVKFATKQLTQGDYKLIAEGRYGCTFTNETSINLQVKYQSVFIQTDKAKYKPGQKVQFRVLVLDRDLKPAKINEMDIFITDVTQNRIKQWSNVKTRMGVYIQELQLATTLTLGIWKINVNVNGETFIANAFILLSHFFIFPERSEWENIENMFNQQDIVAYTDGSKMDSGSGAGVYSANPPMELSYPLGSHSKEFEIAEYILPKYDVTVSVPKDVTYSDSVLRVAVNVKCTYTPNLKGVALVSISQSTWSETSPQTIIQKQVDINGNAYVDFQIKTELNEGPANYQSDFHITASVTEDLTGIVVVGSTDVTIRQYKYTVTNLAIDYSFTPGVAFTLELQFAYYDGSPYVDTKNPIKINCGPNDDNNSNVKYLTKGYMNSAGVAKISITLLDDDNGFYVFVQYLDYNNNVGNYYKALTDKNTISAKLLTKNPTINDNIVIEITPSQPTTSITYFVSARGKLILSATKSVLRQKSVTITLKASFDMVPTAQFVVYYLSDGNIVSTRIEIEVTGLKNFVELRMSATEKQPGENVDITISTKPLSTVYVLAVDQNSALSKSGNDIMKSDVYNELRGYDGVQNIDPIRRTTVVPKLLLELGDPVDRIKRSVLPWNDGADLDDFNSASLAVMTNANVPQTRSDDTMPMAELAAGPANANVPQTAISKHYPETWIWTSTNSGLGSFTLPQIVPDTITSWFITAFATNDIYGLGVTDDKTVFKVFKPFFISPNLPYSVKRGETIVISIVVFNYMPQNVTAKVTLDNSRKEFEFADPHTKIYKEKGCPLPTELSRTKIINIPSNNGTQLSFMITPLIVGPLTIKVNATSPLAGDAIQVVLPVNAEGVKQFKNKPLFVDLRDSLIGAYRNQITIDIPSNAVANSTQVSCSAIGNIMGVTLKNIQSLIQLPCGCGEQNMLGLAPDVAILKYLTKTGSLTSEIEKKLINYLESGYQSEMSLIHPDGSFSAFGTSDSYGSSWLTAFVSSIFIEASEYVTIDNRVINRALEWLKSLQNDDGSISEPGRIIHSDMQGDASKGVALTAYIASVFAQNETIAHTYADVIRNALNYVKKAIDPDDIYSLAVASYAAQRANHSSKYSLLKQFDDFATVEGDLKWWQKIESTPTDSWSQPQSVNVEMTAYGLLTYVAADRIVDAFPIMRWLMSQQSSSGGFGSTQDTVQGVTALAEFASKLSGGNRMSCTFKYETGQSTININKYNSLVLQTVELPSTTESVNLMCTGSGFSLAQCSYQFNLDIAEMSPRFNLTVEIDKNSSDDNLILNICTNFIAGDDGVKSNMALIEVELPTGYVVDLKTIEDKLGKMEDVKKIETKNGNTILVMYLDSVTTAEICLQITAYKVCQVADGKPVYASIYDYYNNNRRKTTFYQITPKDVCAICDDDDCKASCSIFAEEPSCSKETPLPKGTVSPKTSKLTNTQTAIEKLRQLLNEFSENVPLKSFGL